MRRVLFSTCLFKATEIAAYIGTGKHRHALAALEVLEEMIAALPPAPQCRCVGSPIDGVHELIAQAEAGSPGGMEFAAHELRRALQRSFAAGEMTASVARGAYARA